MADHSSDRTADHPNDRTADQTHPAEPSYFVKNLVAGLLPYFKAYAYPSEAALNADILQTLSEYGAATRAQLLHAGLTIAFGFSALDTLKEAKDDPALSPSLRLRFRTCANALNRSCQQNASVLNKRLTCGRPETSPVQTPPAEAVNDLSADEAADILRRAKATIDACRNRLAQPPARLPVNRGRNTALAHLFTEPTHAASPPDRYDLTRQ